MDRHDNAVKRIGVTEATKTGQLNRADLTLKED